METYYGNFQGERCPVETVSWFDATAYCKKLSQLPAEAKHELVYRLPTEAEWEYACRAGSTGKWCFGNDVSLLGDYAWFDLNSEGRTHPVGEKNANAWGLHDMHGNVSEWCEDRYEDGYETGSPTSGRPMLNTRTCRGGGWNLGPLSCRSANRSHFTPNDRRHYVGFRMVAIPGES